MRFELRDAMFCALFLSTASSALAQSAPAPAAPAAPAVKRTQVYKGPVAAGGNVPRHTHPGDEVSYVSDGEIEVTIDGQAPVRVKAGQGFSIPAGKVHQARNVGSGPVHLIGVYVVEKGKPLATPVK